MYPTELLQNLTVWETWLGEISTKFCSDWMIESHFIVQKMTVFLISTTSMTISQGHGKGTNIFLNFLNIFLLSLSQIPEVQH